MHKQGKTIEILVFLEGIIFLSMLLFFAKVNKGLKWFSLGRKKDERST